MPLNQSSSRTKSKARSPLGDSATSKTKKISAYDPNFEQILINNHTYPDNHDFSDGRDPPRLNNENEIFDRLKQTRTSLSPSRFSDKAFCSFGRINAQALHKDDVMSSVILLIQGNASIPSARNLSFENLTPFCRRQNLRRQTRLLRRSTSRRNKPTSSHGVGFIYHTIITTACPSIAQLLHGSEGLWTEMRLWQNDKLVMTAQWAHVVFTNCSRLE